MTTSTAIVSPLAPPAPKACLAGIRVPASAWEGQLALALDTLLASPPRDFYVFRNVVGYAIEYAEVRKSFGASREQLIFTSAAEKAPVATAFLKTFNDRVVSSAGSNLKRTLGWLLLELQLEQAYPLEVESLAAWLRGIASKPGSHQLLRTIAECDGIPQLLRKIDSLADREPGSSSITGHHDFDATWRQSLSAICRGLAERARADEEDEELHRPLCSGSATLYDVLRAGSQDEPDDDGAYEDQAKGPAKSLTEVVAGRTSREAAELYRRSSPDLLRDPDAIAPAALLQRQWTKLVADARKAGSTQDVDTLRSCFLHLLSLEAGLNNVEAQRLVFHVRAQPEIPAIDLGLGVLRRCEVRPPKAWNPPETGSAWKSTGGDALFPLSAATVDCGRALQKLLLADGQPAVFVAAKPGSRRPVTDASHETRIDVFLRAALYRQRLAAALTEQLGQDAAQIAFGDGFGTNTAPTYYAAFEAGRIAQAVVDINDAFVAAGDRWRGPTNDMVYVLGSRVRPLDLPFSLAWQAKGCDATRGRGRPPLHDARERWIRQRDSLALHFALATGHRPTRALAETRLHDFLPQHALAILADKQTDPAHLTRVASTGWRFVGSLSAFLAELGRIAAEPSLGPMHRLAAQILRGDAGIFDTPDVDGNPEALDVQRLFRDLPGTWGVRTNLHRHALCQYLIAAGVDPELRYFQMGWQVHDVHAVSEVGPRGAVDLTAALAPLIDAFLKDAGWKGGQAPNAEPQSATGPLRDWSASRTAHLDEAREHQRRVDHALREARRAARPRVLERLSAQVKEVLPQFKLVLQPSPALRRRPSTSEPGPVVLHDDHLGAVLDVFESPLDVHVARVELRRLLSKAMRAGLCRSPLPSVRTVLRRRSASPFLRGGGLALAHTRLLRTRLQEVLEKAARSGDALSASRLAGLSFWAVAAFTPFRSRKAAREVVAGCTLAVSGSSTPSILRVPTGDGHAVVSGLAALLLQRLRDTEGVEEALRSFVDAGPSELGDFILELMPEAAAGFGAAAACLRMESALLAAGDFELSGPERLVMHDAIAIATVSATRAVACSDDRLVADQHEEAAEESPNPVDRASVRGRAKGRSVRDLLTYFNPSYEGDIGGRPALPARRRVAQLRPVVAERLAAMGSVPTFDVVVLEYVHRLLVDGGPRSRGGMAIGSIYKVFHRLQPAMAAIDVDVDLTRLGSDVVTGAILSSFARARRRDHRDVLDDIRLFFRFASDQYGIEEPDWGMLSTATGCRISPRDPAVVGELEVSESLSALAGALAGEEFLQLDPAERRFREVQLAAGLLLESSAARPASIHGLTLADIHLSGSVDRIHLHATGPFGTVKTATSAGFVPLEGPHWPRHFPWFARWFGALCADLPPDALASIPLFQVPGEPVGTRYRQAEVFGHIGELIRWSTSQSTGRTYWLRKRRVGLRFQQAALAPGANARGVVRAMRQSGHADIRTPLGAYLGDPLFYVRPTSSLPPGGGVSCWAAIAGLSTAAVEQRWRRRSRSSGDRQFDAQAKLKSLMPPRHLALVEVRRPDAPQRRPYRSRFSWRAIEQVLGSIANGLGDTDVAAACWVSELKAGLIRARVEALVRRSGLRVGFDKAALHPPRPTPLWRALQQLVDREDQRLALIAAQWATARRVNPELPACPVYDDDAVAALTQIITEAGLDVRWAGSGEELPACAVVDSRGRAAYGALQALQWSLAVAWIATPLPD